MTPNADTQSYWEVLDTKKVDDLRLQSADAVISALDGGDAESPQVQVKNLRDLAIDGRLPRIRLLVADLRDWAEAYGLRRIANILVELDRVTRIDARGQAILQAQSLTRMLDLHIANDIDTLKDALNAP